jgi:DNA-binding GntR family transcriptional regulator
VYAALKQQLQSFVWVPGDRFSEAEQSTQLGVSRTPVREALFRLRTEGLLDLHSRSGWYVRPIDFARIDGLYELRVLLETHCVAKLCAAAQRPACVDALVPVWLVPAAARLTDGRAVAALDEAFHSTLVAAAGNAEFVRVHNDVTERIRMVRQLDFTQSSRIAATYLEHGKVLRHILRRDNGPAQLLLRSHIAQSQAEVRKITLHTLFEARAQLASG